jgi:hypothetical protein
MGLSTALAEAKFFYKNLTEYRFGLLSYYTRYKEILLEIMTYIYSKMAVFITELFRVHILKFSQFFAV